MMAHRFYISVCIFVVVRGAEIKFRHYDWLWELLRFNVLLTNLSAHREGGMPPPLPSCRADFHRSFSSAAPLRRRTEG